MNPDTIDTIYRVLAYIGLVAIAMGLASFAGWCISKCIDEVNLDPVYDADQARRDMEEALAQANAEVDWRNNSSMKF